MTASKLQRLLFWGAWLMAAILLIRFAIDFIEQMPAWLAAPFVSLACAALALAAINWLGGERSPFMAREKMTPARTLLLLSVPLGFLAASLDCTGLSLSGCTPYCTFIKTIWIPAIAIACVVYATRKTPARLSLILLMSLVPLVPHCLCFNVGNGWWIERVGASPTCYAWGFAASLIAVGGLRAGKREWLSVLVNGAIIGGATVFFISHHYFHFPW